MSAPRPIETTLLATASNLLAKATERYPANASYEIRMQILECAAARLGAFSVSDYFSIFGITSLLSVDSLDAWAMQLLEYLKPLPVHPALALSSLSRRPLSTQEQRETGAYYTDFRLATFIAAAGQKLWKQSKPIVDPACGAGILLTATTLAICGADRQKTAEFLATNVVAADASKDALRGACLSLAALTNDLGAIAQMRQRWLLGDSLLRSEEEWASVAPDGFGLVVANPPWEKLKVTRHEFAKATGHKRHYGADHECHQLTGFDQERARTSLYARSLAKRYPIAVNGEVDLYVAFLELFLRLAANGGGVSALIPAGLIRSEGTARLRQELLGATRLLDIAILENRSRFFAIDTRFKFLRLACLTQEEADKNELHHLTLSHASGTDTSVTVNSEALVPCKILKTLRHDLTIPEVRTSKEWALFAKMATNGTSWHMDEGPWSPEFCREVDMTKEKPKFRRYRADGLLPLIEGRMVHQHRYGAKKYLSGTGRKAVWNALPLGSSEVSPQYWISPLDLPVKAKLRASQPRAGFCDITGQTNERSMMAALIPADVACGNKVPTVLFKNDPYGDKLCLWVGMVNSLPFDWLIRRVVTTTVNYFLLRGVQLPNIDSSSLPATEVVKSVRMLQSLDSAGSSADVAWRVAEHRARIDVLCLIAYGAGYDDLVLMLEDFPLLDRGQTALPGERRSTITRDYLLLVAAQRLRRPTANLAARIENAKALGAIPYVPSQSDVMEDTNYDFRTA